MGERVTGRFRVKSWDEHTIVETGSGGKLTRAAVAGTYDGGIEGESISESVMTYRPDGTAEYVGMERIVGTLAGRSGSFVIRSTGEYDGAEAKAAVMIVRGSATGELSGLRGSGTFSAVHGPEGRIELDCAFE